MNKKDAVERVLEHVSDSLHAKETRVITSCGHISRLAWDWNEKQYVEHKLKIIPFTGAMGMVISFSIGLSMADKTRPVYAIMGDGEFLMGFNALNNMRHQEEHLGRITHVVLDDQMYASTGGQVTAMHEFIGGGCWDLHDWVSDSIKEFDTRKTNYEDKLNLVLQFVYGEYETPGRIPDDILSRTVR